MGRETGATERLSRREGVELELKGARRLAGKAGLERRGHVAPGQHGRSSHRRPSVYGQRLRAKQRATRYYGIREAQFRRYVAAARAGVEGQQAERLMIALERRLDNVVYRLGLAATRAQARQFVVHRHVLVNSRRVDAPSFAVSPGDVVELRIDSPVRPVAEAAADQVGRVAPWLLADPIGLRGAVARLPRREEIQAPVDGQLVTEFYSRIV